MKQGINICEVEQCCKNAKGEYQRVGDERIGWHENMPISLCADHSKKHIPVEYSLGINNGILYIKMWATPGFKLRKRHRRMGESLKAIAEANNIKYQTAWKRAKRGLKKRDILAPATHRKPVIMMNMDKKHIKTFSSIADASRETGINSKHISRVLCGTRRKSTGGYLFKYKAAC